MCFTISINFMFVNFFCGGGGGVDFKYVKKIKMKTGCSMTEDDVCDACEVFVLMFGLDYGRFYVD